MVFQPSREKNLKNCKRLGPTPHRLSISPQFDIDGAASSGALPHAVLGRGPISKTKAPPLTKSLCSNHGLFSGLPFSVAD